MARIVFIKASHWGDALDACVFRPERMHPVENGWMCFESVADYITWLRQYSVIPSYHNIH